MKNRKSFLAGMLTMALLCTLVVSASAAYAKVTKTLSYQDIKVTLNGQQLDPRDANGAKVDPFIIDGTTYLPVRAVSESLGLDVDWNSDTKTVVLSGISSDSSDVKALLGFYKTLEDSSQQLQSFYKDLSDSSKTSLFTNTQPFDDGKTFSETLLDMFKYKSASVEKRYAECKSAGLTDDSDFEMLIEYRRLNDKATAILSQFISGASSSYISSIMSVSTHHFFDSTLLYSNAGIAFWDICNN